MRYIGGYPVTPEVEKRLKDMGLTMADVLDNPPEKNKKKTTEDTYDTPETIDSEKNKNDETHPITDDTKPFDDSENDVKLSKAVEKPHKTDNSESETNFLGYGNTFLVIVVVLFFLFAFRRY